MGYRYDKDGNEVPVEPLSAQRFDYDMRDEYRYDDFDDHRAVAAAEANSINHHEYLLSIVSDAIGSMGCITDKPSTMADPFARCVYWYSILEMDADATDLMGEIQWAAGLEDLRCEDAKEALDEMGLSFGEVKDIISQYMGWEVCGLVDGFWRRFQSFFNNWNELPDEYKEAIFGDGDTVKELQALVRRDVISIDPYYRCWHMAYMDNLSYDPVMHFIDTYCGEQFCIKVYKPIFAEYQNRILGIKQ
tara:strand:- start:103469 stop:104209 length:741 start_codon:yes stop_codon:yes gene_type:complete